MNIDCSSNIGFSGAYRFTSMSAQAYDMLHHIIPKKSYKIYNCVNEKGDVVLVNHACYNDRVKDFIKNNCLKFTYFPKIKLGEKLTKEILQSLIMRDISDKSTINNILSLSSHVFKGNVSASNELLKHLDTIFSTLGLNVENPRIEIMKNGLPKIRDYAKNRTIYFSPNYTSKYYVYVKPDSINQEGRRYLLYFNGEKLIKEYKTPDEIMNFNKISGIIRE